MMSTFGGFGSNVSGKIDPQAVSEWFERRAPESLELPSISITSDPGNLRMTRREVPWQGATSVPFISHTRLADVVGDSRPELIVCDMHNGAILLGTPGQLDWSLQPIGHTPNPAHVEAADLDGDGRQDLVVANLGAFLALDHKLGSVEWFRQVSKGVFQRTTLAGDLGRVADAQPVDIDGDGDLDIVVAEFGWRLTGRLLLLENRAAPGEMPDFTAMPIEGHHGASHVAITDLDGDSLLDIVTLYSQEHEMVRAYLNRNHRWTELRDLYRAPHPAWGHSGFQLIDLDKDGDLDVLLTNGDTYDSSLLKPYHGVRWLENKASLDFQAHDLVPMYGVYRAEAADLNGDGLLDIAACALVEQENLKGQVDLDAFVSLLWLEQVAGGQFVPRVLEKARCHHPNLTLGDYDLDGDIDLFVGNGRFDDALVSPRASCVDVWENELR